jgi:hypothetical protein
MHNVDCSNVVYDTYFLIEKMIWPGKQVLYTGNLENYTYLLKE